MNGRVTRWFAAALLAALTLWCPNARSVIATSVQLTVNPTVTIGQRGHDEITITNTNTGIDASTTNTIDLILLTPSCNQTNGACVAGSESPNVFFMLGDPPPVAESACSGYPFTVSLINPALGLWQVNGPSVALAGTGAFCRITVFFSTRNFPKIDANFGLPEYQTYAVVAARSTSNGQQAMSLAASNEITVLRGCSLDIDGNGSVDPLTDGLLLMRAMFGLTGDAVISGAVAANADRKSWQDIWQLLNYTCGGNFRF